MSLLGSGAYDAVIYADGANPTEQPKDSVVEKRRVNSQTVLKLNLAPGGGSAIRLVPVRCMATSCVPIGAGPGVWNPPRLQLLCFELRT
jgi:hypothetical protein